MISTILQYLIQNLNTVITAKFNIILACCKSLNSHLEKCLKN